MAQDRTHKGRVDFADGLLLEPMAEPTTQPHGTQVYSSGTSGDLYAKTLSGVVHQITPSEAVVSGLGFTEKAVVVGGVGDVGLQSSDLIVDYISANSVKVHPTDGADFAIESTQVSLGGDGPDLNIKASNGSSLGAADGGDLTLRAGDATSVSPAVGGNVHIQAGSTAHAFANGGSTRLFGGINTVASLGVGGHTFVRGGQCLSGTPGTVYIGDNHTNRVFVGGPLNEEAKGIHIAESLSGLQAAGYGHHWTQNAGAGSVPNRGMFKDDQNVDVYTAARRNFVRAWQSGIPQLIAADTWTKVELTAESFDLESVFDHDGGTYRFQPNVPGYYQINWRLEFAGAEGSYPSPTTGKQDLLNNIRDWVCSSAIYKNGSIYSRGSIDSQVGGGTWFGTPEVATGSSGSATVYLNGTTDYVELYVYAWDEGGFIIYLEPYEDMVYMDCHLVNVR